MIKVTDQTVELRIVVPSHGISPNEAVLQYRSLRICVDASGALCPNGYTDWMNVRRHVSNAEYVAATEGRKDE